jgi:arginyl-tRNA--protein-N-Asp/Glu arginylyltransferase
VNKICKTCLVTKELEQFPKGRTKNDGSVTYRPHCLVCTVAQNLDVYHNKGGKEKQKKRSFKNNLKKYNLSPADYELIFNKQNGLCAICGTNKSHRSDVSYNLFVDHCHTTGKVRGLLCHHCNTGLGHFQDNSNYLQKAIEYLHENSS